MNANMTSITSSSSHRPPHDWCGRPSSIARLDLEVAVGVERLADVDHHVVLEQELGEGVAPVRAELPVHLAVQLVVDREVRVDPRGVGGTVVAAHVKRVLEVVEVTQLDLDVDLVVALLSQEQFLISGRPKRSRRIESGPAAIVSATTPNNGPRPAGPTVAWDPGDEREEVEALEGVRPALLEPSRPA